MGAGGQPVDAVSQIVTYLLSFGLPGVCLVVLGWAYSKKEKRIDELQDTLIKMAGDNATALVGATAAINGNNAAVTALSNQLAGRDRAEGRTNG